MMGWEMEEEVSPVEVEVEEAWKKEESEESVGWNLPKVNCRASS